MYCEIQSVDYIKNYEVRVTFKSGESGIVDLEKYARVGGIFEPLADIDCFKRMHLEYGTITWPGEIDIAPETLYCMITGKDFSELIEHKQQKEQ